MRTYLVEVIVCSALLVSACEPAPRPTTRASQPGAQAPAPSSAKDAGPADGDEAVETLKARIAQLEAELDALRKAPPAAASASERPAPTPAEELPTVAELMKVLDARDGAAMNRAGRKLLFGGEAGYRIAHEFFHQCDVEHEKILILTHDLQLTFGLLDLVHLYPDDIVRFAEWLMKATEHQPESFIRREIFNFLPPFLSYHKGRYPELKTRVEEQIVHQLRSGGEYMYKTLLAIERMDYAPPIEDLELILNDPRHIQSHPAIIEHLSKRGPEGERSLIKYVGDAREFKTVTVRTVLTALAGMDTPEARQLIQRALAHPDADLRESTVIAYFVYPRDAAAARYAIDYLNSNAETRRKRSFVARLRKDNRVVLDALKAKPEAFPSEEVRDIVLTEGKRTRTRG